VFFFKYICEDSCSIKKTRIREREKEIKGSPESRGKTADLKWEAGRTGQAKACLLKGPEPEPGG
jgi:hypothetical protein